jgi:Glutaredoxin-like domain (DUF836)
VKLTLLVRAYCHLCDEMHAALGPLLAASGIRVDVIDVDSDAALEARWGEKVPVLLDGAHELCHFRLDVPTVARWLRETSAATSR